MVRHGAPQCGDHVRRPYDRQISTHILSGTMRDTAGWLWGYRVGTANGGGWLREGTPDAGYIRVGL